MFDGVAKGVKNLFGRPNNTHVAFGDDEPGKTGKTIGRNPGTSGGSSTSVAGRTPEGLAYHIAKDSESKNVFLQLDIKLGGMNPATLEVIKFVMNDLNPSSAEPDSTTADKEPTHPNESSTEGTLGRYLEARNPHKDPNTGSSSITNNASGKPNKGRLEEFIGAHNNAAPNNTDDVSTKAIK